MADETVKQELDKMAKKFEEEKASILAEAERRVQEERDGGNLFGEILKAAVGGLA